MSGVKGDGDFPIIMLTSKSSEEERLQGLHLAPMICSKAFQPEELVYRVKAVLKRAQKKDLTLRSHEFQRRPPRH